MTYPPKIATSRYHAGDLIVASGLAPIATSVGIPRWALPYRLVDQAKMLAPYGLLDIADRDEFARRYLARLERYGAERISAYLAGVARREGRDGAVLLCWEDLTKDGAWCHRRLLADRLGEWLGVEVPELEAGVDSLDITRNDHTERRTP